MNDLASETSETPGGMPRLGIWHIMLWTAMSGAHVTLLRWVYGQQDLPGDVAVIQRASGVVHGIIVGAQVTGTIVLVYAWVKGASTQLLNQPGHWLLVIQSIFAALSIGFFSLVTLVLQDVTDSSFQMVFLVFYGLLFLGRTVAYLIAAWFTKGMRWKAVFLSISALALMQTVSNLFGLPFASINLYSFVMLLVAYARFGVSILVIIIAAWDIARSERRDWLHWLGVAAYLVSVYVTLLQWLWQWLWQAFG